MTIRNAKAANAGLLKNFPKGYGLDEEHAPRISVHWLLFPHRDLDELTGRCMQSAGQKEGDQLEAPGGHHARGQASFSKDRWMRSGITPGAPSRS